MILLLTVMILLILMIFLMGGFWLILILREAQSKLRLFVRGKELRKQVTIISINIAIIRNSITIIIIMKTIIYYHI